MPILDEAAPPLAAEFALPPEPTEPAVSLSAAPPVLPNQASPSDDDSYLLVSMTTDEVAPDLYETASRDASGRHGGAAALEGLFTHVTRTGDVWLEQSLSLDGCKATLTRSFVGAQSGFVGLQESYRFDIAYYDHVNGAPGAVSLSAVRYFGEGADAGLTRWLAALNDIEAAPDAAERARRLQKQVEDGQFGQFASNNGYEMQSWLEGDSRPYFGGPVVEISLEIAPDASPARVRSATEAWLGYTEAFCRNDSLQQASREGVAARPF